jgi:aryl-alcohol dehydrogenase-like predicted oxidoreductase
VTHDGGGVRYLEVSTTKKISKIGLGTWQFGSPEWRYGEQYDGALSHAIVRRALELGITLFDTAEIYGVDATSPACRALVRGAAISDISRCRGFGRSEQILGQALRGSHHPAFVATKVYPTVPVGSAVRHRAAASAHRLGTGRLDLYQVHQPRQLNCTAAVMRGIAPLQRAGLIGEVGMSNASVTAWRAAERALGGRVLSNQVSYSLVSRSAEHDVLPFALSRGRAVIAFSPLAQGLLAGRYDRAHRPANPARASAPLFLPDNLDRAGQLISVLREIAGAHGASPAQIALAWVIRHPAVAAIPGASSIAQLESNAAAADIDLADDEYEALRAASALFRPYPGPGSEPGPGPGAWPARVRRWLR